MPTLNLKISMLTYILGMLFLAGALIAVISVTQSYHDFFVPLLIIGIVLLFIGYVTEPRNR